MDKNIIKLLVILLIMAFVGLTYLSLKVSNIDANIRTYCITDINL